MRTAETDATYPQVVYANVYPEVSRSHLPEVLKSVDDYPEVYGTPIAHFNQSGKVEVLQPTQERARYLCGLRRRMFIVVCIIVTLAILGLALGLGISLTIVKSPVSANTPTTDKPEAVDPNRPASFSKLAATNYTDDYRFENQFVFFQVPDGSIRMATQNSSRPDWTITNISDVLKRNPAEIAKGTSITTNVGRFTGGDGLVLCWLSTKSEVTCYAWHAPTTDPSSLLDINALFTSWRPELSPSLYTAAANSSLAIYTKACDYCDRTTTLLWQSQDTTIQGAYQAGPTWKSMSGFLKAQDQSSLGIWTTAAITQDSRNGTALNLYLVANGRTPQAWARLDGTRPDTVAPISKGGTGVRMDQVSSVASWSRSYVDPRADNASLAITVVNPLLVAGMADIRGTEKQKTVQMQYYSEWAGEKTWQVEDEGIESLKPCWEYAMVTATMGARVFCLVAPEDKTSVGNPGIAEFMWLGNLEKGNGTYLDFGVGGRVV